MEANTDSMVLQDVALAIDGRRLLGPLSFTLPARGVTALVGPNGSGKSSLLRLLARQQRPTQGQLHLYGRPLERWNQLELARTVAYLPQQLPATHGLTVRELVALGRYPWHGALGRYGRVDDEAVDAALVATGMQALAARGVDSLSGGERQRAWLAMLIAQHARLVLLDEPISALDVAHQIDVMAQIRALGQSPQIAVVVVLHDVNLAAQYCDHVLALAEGAVLAHERADSFMTPERLSRLYGVPMGIVAHPATGRAMAYVEGRG